MVLQLVHIYFLNLIVTIAMFSVLIVRAWLEYKNYKIMWEEIKRRVDYDAVSKILRSEKNLFQKVEGGDELYKLLCQMFKIEERD